MKTEFAIKTIDSLCIKITDGSHFSPEYDEQGKYPMYSSKDMLYNSFDNSDVKWISEDNYYKLLKQDCRPLKNDILIIKDGNSYLKRVFKVKKTLDAVILSSIAILRPDCSIIDPDYFTYLLRSDSIRNAMSNYVSGAAIPRIVLKDFKKMKLKMISDVELQQKIANILSRYDETIENNNKRIKLLEQMAQNLYKEWFGRFRFPGWQNAEFENGIPKGWKVEKVGNLLKRLSFGKTYKKDELEKEGNVIVIDQSTDDYLGFHNEEPSHKADFKNPIILFGDHSCKFVFMTKNFSLGENVIPIKAKDCNSYFLYRAIDGIIETTEYKRHWSMLCSQKILIPSENLQNEFCIVYKSFVKQIESLKTKNQNLAKQRDLLLPRLMSGKLEVE